MPSDRFYRLSEEKQKIIREAALKEFSRVSFDKASINQIIKEADISRGSFYTYFQDKRDVLSCIFENSHREMKKLCIECLEQTGGNIWEVLQEMLQEILRACSGEQEFKFIKNVIMHSNSREILHGFCTEMSMKAEEINRMEKRIYESMDKSVLKIEGYEEFHRFWMMAVACIGMTMQELFQGTTREQAEKEFVKKLEILRYGVCSQ